MKRVLVIAVAVSGLALTGCGSSKSSVQSGGSPSSGGSSSSGASTGGNAVTIQDFSFKPQNLTVKVGTQVTWTQDDTSTHTVTDQGVFDSGDLAQGKTYTYTFTKAGTYDYICTIHQYMKGTITVQ